MSGDTHDFGSTLSGGIQDVAALLPLLGTDQCERHAGDALAKGYLYGAIIPASLFGCLGAVKVAFAVFLSTITYPFFGGRWLDDAGYSTPGSVASMVTIAKGTGRYGAEVAVEKLLKEQNITDVSLVEKFEISDGRRTEFNEGPGRSSGNTTPRSSLDSQTESNEGPARSSGNTTPRPSLDSQTESNEGPARSSGNTTPRPSLDIQTENMSTTPKDRHWTDVMTQLSWNTMLIICSLLSAVVSITPYLFLMSDAWNKPLSWVFPLLRSFGTCLCVVMIQLALQRRIHRLANLSLEWKKITFKYPSLANPTQQVVLEQRICEQLRLEPNSLSKFLHHLCLLPIFTFLQRRTEHVDDPENLGQAPEPHASAEGTHSNSRHSTGGTHSNSRHSTERTSSDSLHSTEETSSKPLPSAEDLTDEERRAFEELLSPDWTLMLYQLALAVGMGMTVTGYVGCFSLVSQTSVEKGPYVWFGLEVALSLLRIIVWGWNPKWDEGTGLSMSLKLREMRESMDVEDEFIHVTSPFDVDDLNIGRFSGSSPQSFIAYNEENFLGMVTPWVGPLQPLGSPLVTLFYSILFNRNRYSDRKELYTTVYFTDSRPTLTFSINDMNVIFTSSFETNPITRAVQITVLNKAMTAVDTFIESPFYIQIREHCRNLRTRLFCRQQIERLAVMWNVDSLPLPEHSTNSSVNSERLSKYDLEYIALQEAWTVKSEYCGARQDVLEQLKNDHEYCEKELGWGWPASFYAETLFIAESFILEIQLWSKEKGRSTLAECIRTMPLRVSDEKKRTVERYSSYKWDTNDTDELTGEWDDMQMVLAELRQSNEKHEIARKIISDDWSVNDLAQHLDNLFQYSLLPDHLQQCASIPSTTVDVTPTPEQKLYAIFHLWTKRLKTILSKGTLDTVNWNPLVLPDSAAWSPYADISSFSDYTLHIHSALANKPHVLALDNSFLANLRDATSGVKEMNRESEEGREHCENPGRGEEGSGSNAEGETDMMDPQKIITLNSLTTLILSTYDRNNFDQYHEAITNTVKRAPNIICLAGTQCHIPGQDCTQQHCQSVLANRQEWKNGVWDKLSFEYQVGFEGRSWENVIAMGDHIRIWDTGRCFALFYCPSPGELKITFNARRRSESVKLEAMLVSDDGSKAAPLNYEIPVREKKGELEVVTFSFSNVPKGTGSISVKGDTGEWRKRWKIHGLVTLEWVPSHDNEKTKETDDRVLQREASSSIIEMHCNDVNEEPQSTGSSEANLDRNTLTGSELEFLTLGKLYDIRVDL